MTTETTPHFVHGFGVYGMRDRKEIRGEAIHLGDCYVRAEIYHLDSPTDYREYIANDVS